MPPLQLSAADCMHYRIVSALWAQASCLYGHIYIRNRINDTIRPSTSGSQEWCLKLYKTCWLDQNLSNLVLKQLSDGASTTKDGRVPQVNNSFSKKIFSNIVLECIFVAYTHLVWPHQPEN